MIKVTMKIAFSMHMYKSKPRGSMAKIILHVLVQYKCQGMKLSHTSNVS